MVYSISFKKKMENGTVNSYPLFDIEYYMNPTHNNNNEWRSEIHSIPIVKGFVHFLHENLKNDKFDHLQFIEDATKIAEVRGLLYERYGNIPKQFDEAHKFHYGIFGKVIEDLFRRFAEKYELTINID